MENIVYKRDYKEEKVIRDKAECNEISSQIFDCLVTSGTLDSMEKAYLEMPRTINNTHKAAYERILAALDRTANTFGGQIQGVVDYQNWEASIIVILPFVEFSSEDELSLLSDIASNSQTVTFTITPDNTIRMKVLIDYFDIVGNVDTTLEEEIASCPELIALLEETDRKQKEALMRDSQIARIVQIGAKNVGVSEEEFLNQFVSFLRNPPAGFLDRIQGWLEEHTAEQ